jgi:hypothetical protein
MGMPEMPKKCQNEAICEILESIAQEEKGIARMINTEADKVQAAVCLLKEGRLCPDEVLRFQKSAIDVLKTTIKMQILLEFKLEETLDARLKF